MEHRNLDHHTGPGVHSCHVEITCRFPTPHIHIALVRKGFKESEEIERGS